MAVEEVQGADVLAPADPGEAAEAVKASRVVVPRGGGTKWGLVAARMASVAGTPGGLRIVDTTRLAGILQYDPAEYTVTVLAGTRLDDLGQVLQRAGQYLPFDPPLVARGATAGGAVASGLGGPGRLRRGGVRDFVLGIRFVDGEGRLVRAGGKVVKNAAGFDLPKLFCGSLGELGVLVEVTFKVLPAPPSSGTARFGFDRLPDAAAALRRLLRTPLEPDAVDLVERRALQAASGPEVAADDPWSLWVRVSGEEAHVAARLDRVEAVVGAPGARLHGPPEQALWEVLRDLEWASRAPAVLRLHTTPGRIERLDEALQRLGALRHYSVAGHVAWAAMDSVPARSLLVSELAGLADAALALRGAQGSPHVLMPGEGFARRVKRALDPAGRFGWTW